MTSSNNFSSKEFAAEEKLKIVIRAASPSLRPPVGGFAGAEAVEDDLREFTSFLEKKKLPIC